jgi:AraC-like DNA-binding protein
MPLIRTRSLAPLIDIVHRYELAPEKIIGPLGIDIRALRHPRYEDQLELDQAYDLLEMVADKTDCYFLGALLGSEETLSLLGPIGLLMEHSPDVETALQVMLNNQRVQQQLMDIRLATYGNRVSLELTPRDLGDREGVRHFTEAAAYSMAKFLRIIVGPDFRADRICFAHGKPGEIAPYRRLALTAVNFSEEENAIVFGKEYLTRKKRQVDEDLGEALSSYLALLRDNAADDLLTQLDYTIRRQLRSGPCSLELVAEELRMHPRNLQRRLKSIGTSFSAALAAYRSRQAIALLKDTDLQITQIAHRLGYSDATAFGQAFKKWFGRMPGEYRKQLTRQPPYRDGTTTAPGR